MWVHGIFFCINLYMFSYLFGYVLFSWQEVVIFVRVVCLLYFVLGFFVRVGFFLLIFKQVC